MKRLVAVFLLLALICSFGACTSPEGAPPESTPPANTTQPQTQNPTHPTEESTPTPPPPVLSFDVIINEVMPDNEILSLGHNQDWVELYNQENHAISLDGYFLTDSHDQPERLDLSGKSIPAGGFLVIVLDQAAPFRLSAEGETVCLTYGGEIVSALPYGAMESGFSISPSGICPHATPGFPNTEEGYEAYLQTVKLPELIINEAITSNSQHNPLNGEYYDLVEIYNNSDRVLNLADYTFSDKRSQPDRFHFPQVSLEPGAYYVIYCSGNASLGNNHTSFKLSSSGESVYLAKDGVIFDQVSIPGDLRQNQSYGRTETGFAYFSSPTIGQKNTGGYASNLAAPKANHPSGIYEEALTVTLDGSGTIYYTLDGSRPTTDSPVYTKPIPITDVTTIRTFCAEGSQSSVLTAYTYIVGKNHDLPIVNLSIPQDALTGEAGVLNHVNDTYEHEGVVTLIEDGVEKFSVPCGFRLHGHDSRLEPKQNFQLRFRSKYGAGKLKYPLFEDRNIEEYDSLLLKGGSEDWNQAVLRDEFASAIVDGNTNLYTLAIKPVVLYLGGEYWGIYYLRERFSDEYVASHLNVSPESVDILNSTFAYVESGSDSDFKALWTYIDNHDMSKTESFEYLAQRIDITSLLDWYICRSYMGDKDLANIRRFRSSEADGKWYWMWYDLDWAFHNTSDKPLSGIVARADGDPKLIRAVLQSREGKEALLTRYAQLLDTILNDEYFTQVLDALVATIRSEMPQDRARWGYSVAHWESKLQQIRDYTKDNARTNRVLDNLKSYFGLSDAEMTAYFGDHYQP